MAGELIRLRGVSGCRWADEKNSLSATLDHSAAD